MQTFVDANSVGFQTGLLAERVRRELNDAFSTEFDFWCDGRPAPFQLPPCDEESNLRLANQLSLALRRPGPQVITMDGCWRMLAVPIAQNGAVAVIAVAAFCDVESPRRLTSTAQLVLDKIHAEDEVAALRQQNEEHLVQATQDLEELTFLRSIARHLEVTDAAAGMWRLADKVLPSLRLSIGAELLVLAAARQGDDGALSPARPMVQVGDKRINEEACLNLLENFHPSSTTLVRNRLAQEYPAFPKKIRNVIVVPVLSSGALLAWLMAVNRVSAREHDATRWALSQHEFGTNEASLMESAASIFATHEVNVQLLRDKEAMVANVVRALVTSIEAKDNYTRGHSERVALFARCLGRQIGLSEAACDELYLSGLVHDVGKIGVGDAILKKTEKLTDAEFEEIKRHPDEGWAILRDLEQLSYVLPGVLYHHERYDGRGYPDGLAGEEIPLAGRIIAVADAYDAMTSDRAYRNSRTQEEAEAVLREGAASQWDPRVIEAFFAVKDEIAQLRRTYQPAPKPVRARHVEANV